MIVPFTEGGTLEKEQVCNTLFVHQMFVEHLQCASKGVQYMHSGISIIWAENI